MKRFIDTNIWTQNKWFRKLSPKDKLFWIYLFCNCDSVGVWEEDFELVSFVIGIDINKEEITSSFGNKIKWFNSKKLWIVDFCDFQYGTLIEENTANKPHQSYINLLKRHSLWIEYKRTIKAPMNRVKDKEKNMDKDMELVKDMEIEPCFLSTFLTWLKYKRSRGESYKNIDSTNLAYKKLLKLSGNDSVKAIQIVEQSMASNYAGLFELKKDAESKINGESTMKQVTLKADAR